ncbi:MAG: hypothetical protein UZ12_BCD005000264 [Bacteroidetes bacterium OLB12]|nr:MAG: hypothetical protein UZ12_BCD005000264 [Bacteroidetes bacterium OLB12]
MCCQLIQRHNLYQSHDCENPKPGKPYQCFRFRKTVFEQTAKSFDTQKITVLSADAAIVLNSCTDAAQTLVSTLGKIFNTMFLTAVFTQPYILHINRGENKFGCR